MADRQAAGATDGRDDSRPLIHLCGWCPDVDLRTQQAHAAGYRVSHGMCGVCSARELARMDLTEPEVQAVARADAYTRYLADLIDPRD